MDLRISAYYRLLTSDNDFTRSNAARAWSVWEGRCATLQPNPELQKHFSELHFALALARIECHYFAHDSFLEENFILNNAHKLRGIPGVIVHGRYDVVCPLENAWKLHKAWPEAELQIIRDVQGMRLRNLVLPMHWYVPLKTWPVVLGRKTGGLENLRLLFWR